MAKYHYWTDVRMDDSEGGLPAPDPNVGVTQATRLDTDTLLRALWAWKLTAWFDTGGSGNAPVYWWCGAYVRSVLVWDPLNLGDEFDVGDNSPEIIGWDLSQATPFVITPSPGRTAVIWQQSVGVTDVHAIRKGLGTGTKPAVNTQLWPTDHHGVFAGTYGSHVSFSVEGVLRALWASDQPP